MTKVKQKKIVVKKIEWLEVSFHLDEGKSGQYARKTICQENFQDFAKKYRLLKF